MTSPPQGSAEGHVKTDIREKKIDYEDLLDSSGWIEFFTGGSLADRYAAYLAPRYHVITPTIVLYEVYKKTTSIAYLAADLSLRHGLTRADAIVYATAKDRAAEVVTAMPI